MSLNEDDIGKTEDTRHVEESGLDESDESLPMVSSIISYLHADQSPNLRRIGPGFENISSSSNVVFTLSARALQPQSSSPEQTP